MKKHELLRNFLRKLAPDGIALAFSGGTDSSLLLAVLKELHDEKAFPLVALTMHTVFQRPEELSGVRDAAAKAQIPLEVFACDPLAVPEVRNNPVDRCFWCKRHIFTQFRKFAAQNRLAALIDGTNADDRRSYRPGLAALAELKVISPLAELGITKSEIREMADALNLDCAAKPSAPCMATRFEYGTRLTPELIAKAVRGEDEVRKFLPPSADVRLRIHGDIARIEVSRQWIESIAAAREKFLPRLKELGFAFVSLDLEGFRSGSMDHRINTAELSNNK